MLYTIFFVHLGNPFHHMLMQWTQAISHWQAKVEEHCLCHQPQQKLALHLKEPALSFSCLFLSSMFFLFLFFFLMSAQVFMQLYYKQDEGSNPA